MKSQFLLLYFLIVMSLTAQDQLSPKSSIKSEPEYLWQSAMRVSEFLPEVEQIIQDIQHHFPELDASKVPLKTKIQGAFELKHGISREQIMSKLEANIHFLRQWEGSFSPLPEEYASVLKQVNEILHSFSNGKFVPLTPDVVFLHELDAPQGAAAIMDSLTGHIHMGPQASRERLGLFLMHEGLHRNAVGFFHTAIDEGFAYHYQQFPGITYNLGESQDNMTLLYQEIILGFGKVYGDFALKALYISGDLDALKEKIGDRAFYLLFHLGRNQRIFEEWSEEILNAFVPKTDRSNFSRSILPSSEYLDKTIQLIEGWWSYWQQPSVGKWFNLQRFRWHRSRIPVKTAV